MADVNWREYGLYPPEELRRMSERDILRLIQAHGHRGWEVDGETMSTPGGVARIHALTHAWAENYPMVHWAPGDIQLEHELAVRLMKKLGFEHYSPIEPTLVARVREHGIDAWKGKLRGVHWEKAVKVPSFAGKGDTIVYECAPTYPGEGIRVYYDPLYGLVGIAYKNREPQVIFRLTPAQWRDLKKKGGPVRVFASQVLKAWHPRAHRASLLRELGETPRR